MPHFGRVRVADAYPGVNVEHYGGGGGLEFDLNLEPGADPHAIRMVFEGVESIRLNEDGALELKTPGGVIRQLPPKIFRQVEGQREAIADRYILLQDSEVGFEIEEYDDSLGLLIDPVINWATFLGGAGQDFPTTTNAPNPGYLGGPTEGFLARLPLRSRINPGPPVMEPLVTYVGDELQNFSLAIAVSPGARTAALSEQSRNQALRTMLAPGKPLGF